MKKRKSSQAGFTLFEIMIVVGIIVVLAGGVIFKIKGTTEVAKKIQVDNDLNAITTQLRTYELFSLSLPTTEQGLEALVNKPSSPPVPRRWEQLMATLPTDPWNSPYVYRNPGTHNPGSFDLFSLGPDKKESDDDIGNWGTK
ncbi:MAG: type II secretion system major pseudopilin GspG [Candidatus Methylacidiphilales bacterium]|nr:type II secretion system major pseudopilin GspG [Candidatus Methylacidiphilales bacterium]